MVLLTFNIINNRPETISGRLLSQEELTAVTEQNTTALLRLLDNYEIKCSFFIDVKLVSHLSSLIKRIFSEGHEVALYNDGSEELLVANAKSFVENITGKNIRGIRRKNPKLSLNQLKELGFTYMSDIENADILFPFRRLERGTQIVEEMGVTIIPESISPYSQIPYNDFVFQVLPFQYYKNMIVETLKNDEFVIVYLNSGQFTDTKRCQLKMPFYRRFNSGKKLEDKLEGFLSWINENSFATSTVKDFLF